MILLPQVQNDVSAFNPIGVILQTNSMDVLVIKKLYFLLIVYFYVFFCTGSVSSCLKVNKLSLVKIEPELAQWRTKKINPNSKSINISKESTDINLTSTQRANKVSKKNNGNNEEYFSDQIEDVIDGDSLHLLIRKVKKVKNINKHIDTSDETKRTTATSLHDTKCTKQRNSLTTSMATVAEKEQEKEHKKETFFNEFKDDPIEEWKDSEASLPQISTVEKLSLITDNHNAKMSSQKG